MRTRNIILALLVFALALPFVHELAELLTILRIAAEVN